MYFKHGLPSYFRWPYSRRQHVVVAVCIILLLYYGTNLYGDMLYYEGQRQCWQQYCSLSKNVSDRTQKAYIPSSVDEAPTGFAPSIPKSFLIEERNFCHDRPHLQMIAYVHSAIKNVENRQSTRRTWGKASKALGTVFMVGRSKTKEEERIVRTESKLYGDIVQGNYTDMYELLTYKALNALYWVSKNCELVPWVMHSDDDVIIDMYYLIPMLQSLLREGRDNELFCHPFAQSQTNRDGKWKVNKEEYSCETYPTYCSGQGWFTSMKAVNKLLENVPSVKYLWVDDAYLTGLLAETIKLPRTNIPLAFNSVLTSDIGYKVGFLNIKTNKSDEWHQILKYHSVS